MDLHSSPIVLRIHRLTSPVSSLAPSPYHLIISHPTHLPTSHPSHDTPLHTDQSIDPSSPIPSHAFPTSFPSHQPFSPRLPSAQNRKNIHEGRGWETTLRGESRTRSVRSTQAGSPCKTRHPTHHRVDGGLDPLSARGRRGVGSNYTYIYIYIRLYWLDQGVAYKITWTAFERIRDQHLSQTTSFASVGEKLLGPPPSRPVEQVHVPIQR